MADYYASPTARCTLGFHCSLHGFVHGAEAEELRAKIEVLAREFEARAARGELGEDTWSDAAGELRGISDDVDARDSCAFKERCDEASDEDRYYILSRKNSQREVLLWWKPERRGYTVFIEDAGRYTRDEAEKIQARLVDGQSPGSDVVALPCLAVEEHAHLMVHEDAAHDLVKGRVTITEDPAVQAWALAGHGSPHLRFVAQKGHPITDMALAELSSELALKLGGRCADERFSWEERNDPNAHARKRIFDIAEEVRGWKRSLPTSLNVQVSTPQRITEKFDGQAGKLFFTGAVVTLSVNVKFPHKLRGVIVNLETGEP